MPATPAPATADKPARGGLVGRLPQPARRIAFAVTMGVVGAAVSICLVLCCNAANEVWQRLPFMLWLLPILGAASIWLYRRLGLKVHVGAPEVVRDIRDNQPVDPRLAPAVFLGTCASVVGGASVGKTSTTMQMGAALGSALERVFCLESMGSSGKDVRMHGYAAQVGMAAAVAALLLTPLGAVAFVIELSRRNTLTVRHLPTTLLACLVAFAISKTVGVVIVIPEVPVMTLSWETAAHAALIGAACAVAGALYTAVIAYAKDFVADKFANPYVAVIIGGVLIALATTLLGWWRYAGTGTILLRRAFNGQTESYGFLLKALLTTMALGFGFRGGEITPLLICGALMGSALATFVGAYVPLMAALGMLAFLAAASRCPVAAVLMGCDLFGWAGIPFYVVAVAIAYAGSRDVGLYSDNVQGALRRMHLRLLAFLRYLSARGRHVMEDDVTSSSVVPAERIAKALEEDPELRDEVFSVMEKSPEAQSALIALVSQDRTLRVALERSLDLHPELAERLYKALGSDEQLAADGARKLQASLKDHVRAD